MGNTRRSAKLPPKECRVGAQPSRLPSSKRRLEALIQNTVVTGDTLVVATIQVAQKYAAVPHGTVNVELILNTTVPDSTVALALIQSTALSDSDIDRGPPVAWN